MYDAYNNDTTLAHRAAKAVLCCSPTEWVAVAVSPGDIVERYDRDPTKRQWQPFDDPLTIERSDKKNS